MSILNRETAAVVVPGREVERLLSTLDWPQLASEIVAIAQQRFSADGALLIGAGRSGAPEVLAQQLSARAGALATQRMAATLHELALQSAEGVLVRAGETGDAPARQLRESGAALAAGLALRGEGAAPGALWLIWLQSDGWGAGMHAALAEFGRVAALALANAARVLELERTRADLQGLLDTASEALVVVHTASGTIQRVNRAAAELAGRPASALIGLPIEQIVRFEEHALRVGGRDRRESDHAMLIQPDGILRPVVFSTAPAPGDPAQLVYRLRDISDEWRPLKSLILSEKLAAMSRLVTIVAHEVNNPLQAIAGSIHLLSRPIEQEKRDRYLSMMRDELDRLITLVRRTLAIHQPANEGRRVLSIRPLLESAISQIAPVAESQQVEIQRELIDGSMIVFGVGSHLRELFLSLAYNALEAMPTGGRLTIRTLREPGPGEAGQIVIEFEDTGPGIPEAQLQSIFEPFFSGRVGQHGMGLTISYSIVEQHAGHMAVSSSSQGAIFRVSLPLLASPQSEP